MINKIVITKYILVQNQNEYFQKCQIYLKNYFNYLTENVDSTKKGNNRQKLTKCFNKLAFENLRTLFILFNNMATKIREGKLNSFRVFYQTYDDRKAVYLGLLKFIFI